MEVSVIICTYNRSDDLFICLKSLENQLTKPDEVVIVDDGDTTKTAELLRKINTRFRFRIKHIKNKVKQGLPAARNIGIKHAQGDIICFVDDDVILPLTWLQEIIKGYEGNKTAIGVGGCFLNLNSTGTPCGTSLLYRLLSAIRLVLFYKKIGRLSFIGVLYMPINIIMPENYVEVEILEGCNMSFKREAFNFYKFDESYGGSAGGEDMDFCTGLIKRDGKKLICNPNTVVIHKRTQSGGCRVEDRFYWFFRNHTYYLLKNFNMNYFRVLVFSILVMVYSIFTFKLVYLKAIKDGIRQYKQYRGKHGK